MSNKYMNCPGMNCPKCGKFIPTNISELIQAQRISCPHCGLTITIERGKSTKATEVLKKAKEAEAKKG